MSDRLDAVFTPTSCKWAKQCAAPAKKARREALEKLIPSNWCDPLLTGPDAALPAGKHTYTPTDIERLLNAIRERVRAANEET